MDLLSRFHVEVCVLVWLSKLSAVNNDLSKTFAIDSGLHIEWQPQLKPLDL